MSIDIKILVTRLRPRVLNLCGLNRKAKTSFRFLISDIITASYMSLHEMAIKQRAIYIAIRTEATSVVIQYLTGTSIICN